MKKVGIITINDDGNYGNRLQNYATQEVMKKIGVIPETIRENSIMDLNGRSMKSKIKIFLKKFSSQSRHKRYLNFMDFNKNIVFSNNVVKVDSQLNEKYDFFITGSDQVWNPTFGRLTDVELLKFADPKKRISFSASFGIEQLPQEYEIKTKDELVKYKAISVREDVGKKIVQQLTERKDVEVLIDPTMMLNNVEWDEVLRKPKILKMQDRKYILNYFLGNLSDDYHKEICRVAKENDCIIIDIFDKETGFYSCGPSEFLYLEKNAFLVCTDSFHSSVFSIIYDTPFIVFERQDNLVPMNSRLETLLSKFDLQDRKYKGKITDELLSCDYSEAKKILKQEQEKSIKFLKAALDIN